MRAAYVKLDKAASKGVIHKNQAANRKSALAKRAAELERADRPLGRAPGSAPLRSPWAGGQPRERQATIDLIARSSA